MKRDLILLLPCVLLIGALLFAVHHLTGIANDLLHRLYLMFGAAWLGAWIASAGLFSLPAIRRRDFSHFTRCLFALILFWPLMGIATSLAEQWTLHHRMATWDGPGETGWDKMYWDLEAEGPGYTGGMRTPWQNIAAYSLGGFFTAILWFPTLLLASYIFQRIVDRHAQTSVANSP